MAPKANEPAGYGRISADDFAPQRLLLQSRGVTWGSHLLPRRAAQTAAVLLSGGLDSAACAHFLKKRGMRVQGVFISYGQASDRIERAAATRIATHLAIPLAKYTVKGGQSFRSGELAGRNAFLISAALFLLPKKPTLLAVGIHAGSPYYDCSQDFLERMGELIRAQTDGRVGLTAPFHEWSKAQLFDYFLTTKIPLRLTYSCESGKRPPCGRCLSCRDRSALGAL